MSSFEEIKLLFTNEIVNSPQYQVAIKIKNLIIQDIQAPNINYTFRYVLEDVDYVDVTNKDAENIIIQMALKLVLGFDVDINMGSVYVQMNKFL